MIQSSNEFIIKRYIIQLQLLSVRGTETERE